MAWHGVAYAILTSVQPWIPYDADEQEIADLHIIREGIPSSLRSPLLGWIHDRLATTGYSSAWTTASMVHTLEGALGLNLNSTPTDEVEKDDVVQRIAAKGDKVILRTVDFMASWFEYDHFGRPPSEIESLVYYLNLNRSAVEVYVPDDSRNYRLKARLPEGVEELAQAAVSLRADSGVHLSNAWHAAFDLEPNESYAMTEAIRAVEAALAPVVLPKDKKPTLGKAVSVMKDQGNWTLVLDDSDGHPDHLQVIIGMMETLAKAQPDRHSGSKPTLVQAQTHVQLASTLVHWFASGAIVREVV